MQSETQQQNNIDNPRHVFVTNPQCGVETAIIEHIKAGTTPTGSLVPAIPVPNEGYTKGTIVIDIIDGAPAGDLAGTFDIAYTFDGGLTFTNEETLITVANIGADDSQQFIIEFSDFDNVTGADATGFAKRIKNLPFKIFEKMTGTLTNVTISVTVKLER